LSKRREREREREKEKTRNAKRKEKKEKNLLLRFEDIDSISAPFRKRFDRDYFHLSYQTTSHTEKRESTIIIPSFLLHHRRRRHGFQSHANNNKNAPASNFPSHHEQSLVFTKDARPRCDGQAPASFLRVRRLLWSRFRRLHARSSNDNELRGRNRAARTSSAVNTLQEKPGRAAVLDARQGRRAEVVADHVRGARVVRPEASPLHVRVDGPLQGQRLLHGGQARDHNRDVRRWQR